MKFKVKVYKFKEDVLDTIERTIPRTYKQDERLYTRYAAMIVKTSYKNKIYMVPAYMVS